MTGRGNYLRSCHPFLIIKKLGSAVCKNNTHIQFNLADCAVMLRILMEARIPLTAQSLEPLADGIIYHATEQMGQMGSPLLFNDIKDESFKCVAVVAQPYIDTMLNVYVGSAVVFQHYERLFRKCYGTNLVHSA